MFFCCAFHPVNLFQIDYLLSLVSHGQDAEITRHRSRSVAGRPYDADTPRYCRIPLISFYNQASVDRTEPVVHYMGRHPRPRTC